MIPSLCQGKNFMVAEEENDFSKEGGRNNWLRLRAGNQGRRNHPDIIS
jgi:hypothetical protein